MIQKISGHCQCCGGESSVLAHNGKLQGRCLRCGEVPFGLKTFKGLIYIVKNPNQKGVKIGKTERPIEKRLKDLSSTGVPGKFQLIAIFPSDRPSADEEKIHNSLRKCKIDKEHFDIPPIDAVLKCFRTLNRAKKPIFIDKQIELEFHAQIEENRELMQVKLGKKDSELHLATLEADDCE